MQKLLSARNILYNLPRKQVDSRCLWGWLNTIFNRVDPSRIEAVGPDRACAEWLLRCGAAVKWMTSDVYLNDYNSLPAENVKLYIREIDATDSAVMHVGFPHLKGLKHLERIVLHKCGYVEDEALSLLVLAKDSLLDVQVSSCGNVTDSGVMALHNLSNLKKLLLYDLPEVRDKTACTAYIQSSLPGCQIEFPYAAADEVKK